MELSFDAVWTALDSMKSDLNSQSPYDRMLLTILGMFVAVGYSVVSTLKDWRNSGVKLTYPPNQSFIETLDMVCSVVEDEDEEDEEENVYAMILNIENDHPHCPFLYWKIEEELKALEILDIEHVKFIVLSFSYKLESFLKPQDFCPRTLLLSKVATSSNCSEAAVTTFSQIEVDEILSKLSVSDWWNTRTICKEWQQISNYYLERSGPWVLMSLRNKDSSEYYEEIWCPRMGLTFPVRVSRPKYCYRVVASSKGLVCAQLPFHHHMRGGTVRWMSLVLALVVGNPITNKWMVLPRLGLALSGYDAPGYAWDVKMKTKVDGTFKVIAVPTMESTRNWHIESSSVPIVYDSNVGSWKRLQTTFIDVEKGNIGTWEDIQAPVFMTDYDDYNERLEPVVYVVDKHCFWKLLLPTIDEDYFIPMDIAVECPGPRGNCYCEHDGLFHWKAQGLREEDSGRIFIVSSIREKVYIRGFVIYELHADKSLIKLTYVRSNDLLGRVICPSFGDHGLRFHEPFRFSLEGGYIFVSISTYDTMRHGVWKPMAYNLEIGKWSTLENVQNGIDYEAVCIFTPSFLHKREHCLQETTIEQNMFLDFGASSHLGDCLDAEE